jgi:hypothetical protein
MYESRFNALCFHVTLILDSTFTNGSTPHED